MLFNITSLAIFILTCLSLGLGFIGLIITFIHKPFKAYKSTFLYLLALGFVLFGLLIILIMFFPPKPSEYRIVPA